MLSIYPAIADSEFEEAGKILEKAWAASFERADWIEVRWIGKELQIRKKQDLPHALSATRPDELKDGEFEEPNEIEEEDEVIPSLCDY